LRFDDGGNHSILSTIIDARTQFLYGFEVLTRWSHHNENSLPYYFIEEFEENGFLPEMTQNLLRQVALRYHLTGIGSN
jgi:EAL domain-containing protein (putative c-di-GMP-specific phosphodiesterase class I)